MTPLEPIDYFQLTLPSDPQIAPDGAHLAYVRTRADVDTDAWVGALCVIDLRTHVRRELGEGDQPRWSPDGQTLAFVQAGDGGASIVLWAAASGAFTRLARYAEAPTGLAWSPDGRQLAFVKRVPPAPAPAAAPAPAWQTMRRERWAPVGLYTDRLVYRADGFQHDLPRGHHHIFVLDIGSGALRQLTDGPYDHGSPATNVTKLSLAGRMSWTPDGRQIVMSMQRDLHTEGPWDPAASIAADVYAFDLADGAVQRLTHFGGAVCRAVVSPDGRWIAFVGFRNTRKAFHTNLVHLMPMAGGEPVALPHPEGLEVHQDVQWLPDSSGLLVLLPRQGEGCLAKVDLQGCWTTLVNDVGGSITSGYVMWNKCLSISRTGQVAYLQGSRSRSDEVVVRSFAADGVSPPATLTHDGAWLADKALATIEPMWLPMREPMTPWQAWLVRPAGVPADEPLPLILWLHGGPYLSWGSDFAMAPQLWAARGYAVLMVNPRGSLGYGQAFTEALHHDFPGADDMRLVDAVDAVVARGGIDAQRVFVAGESGGGVLTSWLIGHTHRFAAAAVIYGVMDWTSSVLTVDRPDYYPFYWMPAPPWEPGMQEQYWQRSPVSRAPHVQTPTIVLCGECDWRTPLSQSEAYYTALKLCGVDAALVRFPDAGHGLEEHPSHWMELLDRVDQWFRSHEASPRPARKR